MSKSRAFYPAMSPQPTFAEQSVPTMNSSPVESSAASGSPTGPPKALRGKLTKGPKALQGLQGCQHALSGWTPVGYYKRTREIKSHADLHAAKKKQAGQVKASGSRGKKSSKAAPAKEDLLRPPSTQPTRSKSTSPGYTDSDAGSSAPPSPYSATSLMELDDDDLSKTVVLEPRDSSRRPPAIHTAASAQRGVTFQNPYGSGYNAAVSGSSSSGLTGEGSMPDLMADSQFSVIQREGSTGSMSSVLLTPESAQSTSFSPHRFNGYGAYGPNGAASAPVEGLNLPPSINRHEVANGTPSIIVDDASEQDWQMVHHNSVRDGSGFNYAGPTASYGIQPLFTGQGDYFGFPSFANESGRY